MKNEKTIKLIKLYQKHKRISGRCHFIPSCSNYAIGCYEKFNWLHASFLTGFRILRCTPFTKRRVDPVPLSKEEKRKLKVLNSLKETFDACFIDTVINHSFKYPKMESIDYIILTLEYLFGYSHNSSSTSYNIEFIGKNFIRSNYNQPFQTEIDYKLLNDYLKILEKLSENNFIKYNNCSINDYKSLSHSKTYVENYPTNYHVTSTKNLPLSFFEQEIKKYFSTNTIIGFENVDNNTLNYFKEEWNAEVIDIKDFKKHPKNLVTIITGNNLTNPKIAYHLNCIVKFYNQDEDLDIYKYNVIIPK